MIANPPTTSFTSVKGPSSTVTFPPERRTRELPVVGARPPLAIKDLAIDGHDVIDAIIRANLRPKEFAGGPEVGKVLRALRDRVIDDPSLNTKERLREEMAALLESTEISK